MRRAYALSEEEFCRAEAGISLARDDARQIAMRDAQHQNSHPQAGTSITHLLEKLISE